MFRRIELINEFKSNSENNFAAFKHGLCGVSAGEVADAWTMLNSPKKLVRKNCRFFFTEKGWDKYGRKTVEACLKSDQKFRIVTVKEKSVDVIYKDELQVAVRFRKKS
jgi:hypothetical protein